MGTLRAEAPPCNTANHCYVEANPGYHQSPEEHAMSYVDWNDDPAKLEAEVCYLLRGAN